MSESPSGLPWFHWMLGDESEVDPHELHNLILPESKIEVGETVHLTIGHPAHPQVLGTAEVLSVKQTRIGDLEALDFRRCKSGCQNAEDIVAIFHQMDPASDATLASLCFVITIRRNGYDLGTLGQFVAKDEEYRGRAEHRASLPARPCIRLVPHEGSAR